MDIATEAILGLFGVALTAGLATLSALVAQLYRRVANVEDHNRQLWTWARKQLDLYYRYRRDGAPDPDPMPDLDTN